MIVIVVAVLIGIMAAARIVYTTGGLAGRLARRLVSRARHAWAAGDGLSRLTQASGYGFVATFILPSALLGDERWEEGRVRVLAALAALTLCCAVGLIVRRIARRVRQPRADERLWTARELLYADADREGLAVLSLQSEQYRTPVGQRCWTVHHASGDVEDSWFAGQAFPVGSLVLATRTADAARRGVSWLTPEQLAAAYRHDQRLRRAARHERLSQMARRRPDPLTEPVVAEAEAILRREQSG